MGHIALVATVSLKTFAETGDVNFNSLYGIGTADLLFAIIVEWDAKDVRHFDQPIDTQWLQKTHTHKFDIKIIKNNQIMANS